ncbi:MAG: preprotein translocase subunit SecB [Candidatus Cloacimonetes bacterium ADurb.Bin088]|jgi:preprotein translocase subunit SecB|nr:MAG: preprotein translocase subunit SecB [Candidatus Cloacimonetes bacterium ADurb.Bin088]HOG93304.1 protein-export chaperone SecB [Opitutaceae bacterium]HQL21631.1 protein-export chaperone SecB [Opitutaceae bacterium]
MGPSPFTLERAFFRKIAIQASLEKGAVPPKSIKTKIKTAQNPSDPLRVQIILTVALAADSQPPAGYFGEVELVGLFRISEKIPAEDRERLTAINGATLLFGMAREMICTITARGPWPMFVLPVVSFAGLKKLEKGPLASSPADAAPTELKSANKSKEPTGNP